MYLCVSDYTAATHTYMLCTHLSVGMTSLNPASRGSCWMAKVNMRHYRDLKDYRCCERSDTGQYRTPKREREFHLGNEVDPGKLQRGREAWVIAQ